MSGETIKQHLIEQLKILSQCLIQEIKARKDVQICKVATAQNTKWKPYSGIDGEMKEEFFEYECQSSSHEP